MRWNASVRGSRGTSASKENILGIIRGVGGQKLVTGRGFQRSVTDALIHLFDQTLLSLTLPNARLQEIRDE